MEAAVHGSCAEQPNGTPGGMRANYSCGSLQAAEQLEALMQQRGGSTTPGGGACCGVLPGADQNGLMNCAMNVKCGVSSAGGFLSTMPLQAVSHAGGLDPVACNVPFGAHGDSFSQTLERMDFSPGSLPLLMRGAGEPQQRAAMCGCGDAFAGALSAPLLAANHHAACAAMQNVTSPLQTVASPLSMLYAGATATLGPGHVPVQGVPSTESLGEQQQKRRFVWSPELHSRFEAAVNALGLDAAKPKSILRLMNVDGLTKANIKSHLQKYRCLMQKRQQAAHSQNPAVCASGAAGSGWGVAGPCIGERMDPVTASAMPAGLSSPAGVPGAALGSGPAAGCGALDLSSLSSDASRAAPLPEALISQGGSSLQRNLEVQEMTLKVQMDLQEELSRQLQLQKRLQTEMEAMMQARAAEASQMDESSATSTKMNSILALKHKLQHELQAHLRMQHQLLSQLNQVVLPVIGGDALGCAPAGAAEASGASSSAPPDDEDGEEGEDGEDGEDGEEDEGETPIVKCEDGDKLKRQRVG